MLELLERLTLACAESPLEDKGARRDFLLVSIDFPISFTRLGSVRLTHADLTATLDGLKNLGPVCASAPTPKDET